MLSIHRLNSIFRCYSIKSACHIKYTTSINLPNTKFPSRLTTEKRQVLEKKLVDGPFACAYRYQNEHNDGPSFVLHDGPPYANGDLHVGHAVNKILKDITVRQKAATGHKVDYVLGWDCHGLPIELKALASDLMDNGEARTNDAMAIRDKSCKFAIEAVAKQKAEFRSWGLLTDLSNVYLTMSPNFIINQLMVFADLYEKKLVYRDLKPVYWSPSSRTALAESELEYDPNFDSPSIYVRFKLHGVPEEYRCNSKIMYALVWTTTPWTLPSNQAICYNPHLQYSLVKISNGDGIATTTESSASNDDSNVIYVLASTLLTHFQSITQLTYDVKMTIEGSQLKHWKYEHLINASDERLPFYPAAHVHNTKGTGLVHMAPAHGKEDYLISLSNNLPIKSLVDETGCYNADAPEFLRGKDVLTDGNDLVLQRIYRDVIFSGRIKHSFPIDWRTKKPVLMRASNQWFINTDKLMERAVNELDKINIYPRINCAINKKAMLTQITNRPYWCISRQRVWGVPIPVLYNRETQKILTNRRTIEYICELVKTSGGIDFWWTTSVVSMLPIGILSDFRLPENMMVKGTDIFDIWFDSGSTWFSALKDDQVADLCLEGGDQINGWFQSSLLLSLAMRNRAPFKSLFVHGFTVDDKGLKMSKSLGNVITPKEITNKYGVDVLRWWVAAHGTQHASITVTSHLLKQSQDSVEKIRYLLRYLNGAIGRRTTAATDHDEAITSKSYLDKFMLSRVVDFEKDIQNYYDSFEYNRVIATVQNFLANDISAVYIHLSKDRLYCGTMDEIESVRATLAGCYEILCKCLWPIIPFLIEESWSYYDDRPFHEAAVKCEPHWKDPYAERIVQYALTLKRRLNTDLMKMKPWSMDVKFAINNNENFSLLLNLQPRANVAFIDSQLCELLQVGRVIIVRNDDRRNNDDVILKMGTLQSTVCARCRRYAVLESRQSFCPRCMEIVELRKHAKQC